jgi:hypothetical protein
MDRRIQLMRNENGIFIYSHYLIVDAKPEPPAISGLIKTVA